jgi:hypothetical protein
MTKVTLLAAAAMFAFAPITASFAATAMSDEDCTAMMTSMDKNADGNVGMDEGKPLFDKMAEMKKTTKSPDMITKDEFMTECKTGELKDMKLK